MDKILVVEDVDSLRNVLVSVLQAEGYQAVPAANAEEGLALVKDHDDFSLVLSDLKLPGKNGLDFLRESKDIKSDLPVVVMTAFGTIDIAVQAMKLGAIDFITKPFDPSRLCNLIKQISEHKRIVDRLPEIHSKRERFFITKNTALEDILYQARRVAAVSSSVLILGESGTGKDLLARYIHSNGARAGKPFIAVDCASLPGELLESEFFGHEAGAFTGATEQRLGLFEVAHGGTIFLDEIGNMPINLQMKLLRVLQDSEIRRLGSTKTIKVDVRVIAATNSDIHEQVRSRKFREDLYYRLGVVILEIPPLRERKEDIALLSEYFIDSFSKEFKKAKPQLSDEALQKLESYPFPGNVRELENSIEHALVFSKENVLRPEHFPLETVTFSQSEASMQTLAEVSSSAAKSAEKLAIVSALGKTNGNKSQAARILGVSYKTLLNKVKEFGLSAVS